MNGIHYERVQRYSRPYHTEIRVLVRVQYSYGCRRTSKKPYTVEETALPIERQFITDLYRINH